MKKFIPPSNDLMFKNLFGTEENIMFTIDMLHKLLKLSYNELEELTIVNSVKLNKETIENKHFEMDVLIRLKNGDLINLEMQQEYDEEAESKSLMYLTGTFYKSLKKGESYDNVHKVIGITFVKNLKIHKDDKLIKKYFLTNEVKQDDKILKEKLCMIIVDLECACEYLDNEFEGWRLFLNLETKEEMEEVRSIENILEDASKESDRFMELDYVQSFENDEKLRRSREKRHIEEARNEGISLGLTQGRNEKQYEIVKAMIENNETIDKIMLYTNLSKEEIQNIIDIMF